MSLEIERKFLVNGDAWRSESSRSETMAQGYLAGPPAARCSVRVRVAGERAFLTIKRVAAGIARDEYEYAIPLADAQHMLATLAGVLVEKKRNYVEVDGHIFEIDEFAGANAGLIVAELELDRIDATFPKPAWLGREVSSLARYYNVNLATHPYARWSAAERHAEDAGPIPLSD